MPPPNDDFANAIDLASALSGTVTGTNVGATTEVGEPVASDSGQPAPAVTVWWKWTCPAGPPGYVAFSTRGSTFDTVLGIYMGAAVNALTERISNDDNGFFGGSYSQVVFVPTAGVTYYIQVDGFNAGQTGDIVLSWLAGTAPTPAVTTGHGTGTNSVSLTVGGVGSRGCATVVLGSPLPIWNHPAGFTCSVGAWVEHDYFILFDDAANSIYLQIWRLDFDEATAPASFSPTFTAVQPAPIAYAWDSLSFAVSTEWVLQRHNYGRNPNNVSPLQVVDPDLHIGTIEGFTYHYVGIAGVASSAHDFANALNPTITAAADAPLTNEAQDQVTGPIIDTVIRGNAGGTPFTTDDWTVLVGIASDLNITLIAGQSGTRTWTTTWGPPYTTQRTGPDGAAFGFRGLPWLVAVPVSAKWFVGRVGW